MAGRSHGDCFSDRAPPPRLAGQKKSNGADAFLGDGDFAFFE